jgi:hypothetical protein
VLHNHKELEQVHRHYYQVMNHLLMLAIDVKMDEVMVMNHHHLYHPHHKMDLPMMNMIVVVDMMGDYLFDTLVRKNDHHYLFLVHN